MRGVRREYSLLAEAAAVLADARSERATTADTNSTSASALRADAVLSTSFLLALLVFRLEHFFTTFQWIEVKPI